MHRIEAIARCLRPPATQKPPQANNMSRVQCKGKDMLTKPTATAVNTRISTGTPSKELSFLVGMGLSCIAFI